MRGESETFDPMVGLAEIADLSQSFGTDCYVRGGGGNTSVKDADTLWVKPSGTTLAGMTPEGFVALNREKIGVLYATDPPESADAREALVKDLMQAAVRTGSAGRPSVEAPLHNVFEARYVVHTHPAYVNGMTCACEGREACAALFPDALWVPYIDPGYTLCMQVREEMATCQAACGRQPEILVLENHGIFVAGDTAAEIHERYAHVMKTLESAYREANIPLDLASGAVAACVETESERRLIQRVLGDQASVVVPGGCFRVAEGPLTPDHIVYAKSFPFKGALSETALEAFRREHGYAPRVIATSRAVYGVGNTQKQAELALEFARDAAHVVQLAEAFGGVQWMSEKARIFIENWEVESYRSKVSS